MTGRAVRRVGIACAVVAAAILGARFAGDQALRRSFDRLQASMEFVGIEATPDGGWREAAIVPPALSAASIGIVGPERFAATGRGIRLERSSLGLSGPSRLAVRSIDGVFHRAEGAGETARVAVEALAVAWSATRMTGEADGVAIGPATSLRAAHVEISCLDAGRGLVADFGASAAEAGDGRERPVAGHVELREGDAGGLRWSLELGGDVLPHRLTAHGTLATSRTSAGFDRVGTLTAGPGWPSVLDGLARAHLVTAGERVATAGLLGFLADPAGGVTLPLRIDPGGLSIGPYRVVDRTLVAGGRRGTTSRRPDDGALSACWKPGRG